MSTRGARLRRMVVLVTVMCLLIGVGVPSADAAVLRPATVSWAGVWRWLTQRPAHVAVPVQRTGTAAGKPHAVPAAATRAARGSGQPPGRGAGQLPPFALHAPIQHPTATGTAVGDGSQGFDSRTSVLQPAQSQPGSALYRNADGTSTRLLTASSATSGGSGAVYGFPPLAAAPQGQRAASVVLVTPASAAQCDAAGACHASQNTDSAASTRRSVVPLAAIAGWPGSSSTHRLTVPSSFSGGQSAQGAELMVNFTSNVAPQIDTQYPPDNYGAPTLTPELMAAGHDPDNGPSSLTYVFTLYSAAGTQVAASGSLSAGHWIVPAGTLSWGQEYYWTVQDYDGSAYSAGTVANYFSTQVPQPLITSTLAQNSGEHGLDPAVGDYTTSATDVNVHTAGLSLSVQRDYNSLDPRQSGGFGAGWSTVYDMKATQVLDSTGAVASVVVTYPNGSEVGFGRNGDGSFSSPEGRYATLTAVTGGYTLSDKSETVYRLTQATSASNVFALSSIADYQGRSEAFSYSGGQLNTVTSAVSGRSLHFTWSTPTAAQYPHVATVFTDPSAPGQWSTAQTWTYAYSGDELTTVCPATSLSACTGYTYGTGNHFPVAALDAGPHPYLRLDDAFGTSATSSVLANEGADDGTYNNVTLGQPGPLPGSAATAASFDGATSYVHIANTLMNDASYLSFGLWFKTTTAGGVLASYQTDQITPGAMTTNWYTPILYVGTDGKLNGDLGGTSVTVTSPSPVTDGQWHYAMLTEAGTTQSLYLDGTLAGSASGAGLHSGLSNVYLGAGYIGGKWPDEPHYMQTSYNGFASYFTGTVSDAAVYSTYLSGYQVSQLYATGHTAAPLLTKITNPSGAVGAQIGYDPVTGRVSSLTDENGGVWGLAAPTVSGSSQVFRSAVLGAAPAGYWRLGDSAATQAADEVNGGYGQYSNVTLGLSGPFQDAAAAGFNGSSSYVQLPSSDAPGTGPDSIGLWFQVPKGNTSGGVLYSYESNALNDPKQPTGSWDPALYVGTDGKLHGEIWNGGTTTVASTVAVNDGAWHYAVLAAGTNSQTLYLDGVAQGTLSGNLAPSTGTYVYIGAGETFNAWPNHAINTLGYFTGSIADVAFYRSTLTSAQVTAQYAAYKSASGIAPVETATVTDPGGKTLSYAYDPLHGNRPISETDALGHTTTDGYDTGGYLYTVTDPNGDVTTTGHDVRGNIVSQTSCQNQAASACSTEYYTYYPDDTSAALSPDPRDDLLLTSSDGRSSGPSDTAYRTVYGYDAAGDRTSVTTPPVPGFPHGRTSTTAYTTTSTPAANGGHTTAGLPMSSTSAAGATETLSYFSDGDPATVIDADGQVTDFAYDALGRATSKTVISDAFPNGEVTSYTYDDVNRVVTQTDPAVTDHVTGAVHTARTTNNYDADGNITSVTVADLTGGDASRTTATAYNNLDQAVSTTDPTGATTRYTYTAYGDKASETDAAGNQTLYAYDPTGNVLTATLVGYTGDPANPSPATNLVEESKAYDPAGRLATLTDSMGNVTAYTYTDDGLLATATRQDPATGQSFLQQSNTYDAAGNLVRRLTNNGTTTTAYSVDAADRTTSAVLDPTGLDRTTTYAYDPDDRVLTTTNSDPSGSTRTIDATYSPEGRTTSQSLHEDTSSHPTAWWPLNDANATATTSAADSSGAQNIGTANNGVAFGPASASFNGTNQSVTANAAVDTSHSYTVSAWALVTGTASKNQTIVSQDGSQISGFFLQYDAADNRWSFAVGSADSTSGALQRANSTAAPTAGVWTHLTGVYDASAGTITLYVNGVANASTRIPPTWKANGPLAIGRGDWGNSPTDWTGGSISDVQLYSRALTASDVAALYSNGSTGPALAGPAGWWTLRARESSIPAVAQDDSGAGQTGTISTSGLTWSGGYATFDGTSGDVTAPAPIVNTTQSYTVSAWAKVNPGTTDYKDVVSQDGTNASAFELLYAGPYNTWSFSRSLSDTNDRDTTQVGSDTAVAGTWTHLVGVYDATASTISLYVNGQLQGTTSAGSAPWSATGPTVIGRSLYNGAVSNHFPGQISNVQLYPRALSSSDVTGLYGKGIAGSPLGTTRLTSTTTLDQRGLPTASTDPQGNTTGYLYDEAGKLAEAVAPTVDTETDGAAPVATHPVTTYGYDTFADQVSTEDPDGNVTTTGYDADGRPVRATLPSYLPPGASTPITASTTRTYTGLGQVHTATDALGNTSTYGYDQLGDTTDVTNPNGGDTHTAYDTNGDKLSTTDPSGAQRTATYNWLGQPLTSTQIVRQPALTADTTTYAYNDTAGSLSSTTTPAGVTTSYGYDTAGEQISATDGAGNTTRYAYDFLGRPAATTFPDGTSERATYDPAGNQTGDSALDSSGTTLRTTSAQYDADGHQTSTTDAMGAVTTFGYDATGLLTQETQPVAANTSIATSFGYDAAGNRTRYTDGNGNPTLYTYNSWNLPESTIVPATTAHSAASDRTFTTQYDADGNPVGQSTPGGVSVTATYDKLGRLTAQSGTGADAPTASRSFGYDAAGDMTFASTGSATDTFTYDDRGLPLTVSGASGTSNFTYNADGEMASRTDAAGTSTYAYDNTGRLSTLTDALTGAHLTYAYTPDSQLSSINYGPGEATRAYTYNPLHELTGDTLTAPGGQTEASIAYGYNLNGDLTSKTTTGVTGAGTNTYTYDQANRLTSWNNGATTTAYTYDADGNRTQAGSQTFTYDARNELLTGAGDSYTYTARGTQASVTNSTGTISSTSDAYGQVTTSGPEAYTYDALGRTLTAQNSTFSYSGLANTPASDGSYTYSHDPDGTLTATAQNGSASLTMLDAHRDVIATFTATGTALTASRSYDPLGNVTATSGQLGNLGYQSGWTDPGNGTVNMGSRWYNPAAGQFTSRDHAANNPAPNSAAANTYAYGDDNPLTAYDPAGTFNLFGFIGAVAQNVVHTVAPVVQHAAASAWHTVTTTVAKVAKAVTSTPVYHAVAKAVSTVVKTVQHAATVVATKVNDAAHKVATVYHQAVTAVTHVVHTAVTTTTHAVAAATNTVVTFVQAHKAAIASFAVGTAVFIGCEVAVGAPTAGAGAVVGAAACGALSGAVAGAVGAEIDQQQQCSDPKAKCTTGSVLSAIGLGALTGGIAGGIGGALAGPLADAFGGMIGSALPTFASKILGGAASGAIVGALGGGISGGISYAANCANTCSLGGFGGAVLSSAASGAAGGAVGGAIAGGLSVLGGGDPAAGSEPTPAAEPTPTTEPEPGAGGEGEPDPSNEDDPGNSCHSFDPSTQVLMADGSTKAIKDVKLGDKVDSTDPATGKNIPEPVVALHDNHDTDLADVTVQAKNGASTVLHTTWHHPFWNATTQQWTDAAALTPGTRLHAWDGDDYALKVVSVKTWTGLHDMRDLTVAQIHTYYVLAIGTAILVHNVGGPPCNKTVNGWPKPEGGNCEACANKIQKMIGGRVQRIDPNGAPVLGPSVNNPDGDWAYHYAVIKDGVAYDGFTGKAGLPVDAYKAQWQYSRWINFGF